MNEEKKLREENVQAASKYFQKKQLQLEKLQRKLENLKYDTKGCQDLANYLDLNNVSQLVDESYETDTKLLARILKTVRRKYLKEYQACSKRNHAFKEKTEEIASRIAAILSSVNKYDADSRISVKNTYDYQVAWQSLGNSYDLAQWSMEQRQQDARTHVMYLSNIDTALERLEDIVEGSGGEYKKTLLWNVDFPKGNEPPIVKIFDLPLPFSTEFTNFKHKAGATEPKFHYDTK